MCSVSIYIVYDTFNVLILLKDVAKHKEIETLKKYLYIYL